MVAPAGKPSNARSEVSRAVASVAGLLAGVALVVALLPKALTDDEARHPAFALRVALLPIVYGLVAIYRRYRAAVRGNQEKSSDA
jgi:hypothetical protein